MVSRWGLTWGGWLDNRRGEWWLLAQMILIAAHLLPPWPAPATWGLAIWPRPLFGLGSLILLAGFALAGQGFLALGGSLSPLPAPRDDNRLITNGAYQRCRHPLYQAVLVCSLGVVIALGSVLHLLLLIALTMVLRGKAKREEKALLAKHPDYAQYRQSVPAIVPGLPGLDWRSR